MTLSANGTGQIRTFGTVVVCHFAVCTGSVLGDCFSFFCKLLQAGGGRIAGDVLVEWVIWVPWADLCGMIRLKFATICTPSIQTLMIPPGNHRCSTLYALPSMFMGFLLVIPLLLHLCDHGRKVGLKIRLYLYFVMWLRRLFHPSSWFLVL